MPGLLDDFTSKPIEESGDRLPVTWFKGTLQKISTEQNERFNSTRGVFDFVGCEILESTEPYPFPVVKLNIGLSRRENTYWIAMENSVRNIMGTEIFSLYNLEDKKQEWKRLPTKIGGRPRNEDGTQATTGWEVVERPAWHCVAVEGYASASDNGMTIWEGILSLITAPITEAELSAKVFNAHEIKGLKGFSDAVTLASDRAIGKQLLAMGLVTQEGDKWVKV